MRVDFPAHYVRSRNMAEKLSSRVASNRDLLTRIVQIFADERGFDDNPARARRNGSAGINNGSGNVMIERRHDALGLILRYSGLNCSFLKRSTFCGRKRCPSRPGDEHLLGAATPSSTRISAYFFDPPLFFTSDTPT